MRAGNGGGKIEDAKALKALRRIVRGISPFCHSRLLELMYRLAAETLSAAVIPGKRFPARQHRRHRRFRGRFDILSQRSEIGPFLA
jgi:hypothetical protein